MRHTLILIYFLSTFVGAVYAVDKPGMKLTDKKETPQSPSLHGNGLMFTQNKGQVADDLKKLRPDVLFKGTCSTADIYLRKTGVSYVRSNMADIIGKVQAELDALRKNPASIPSGTSPEKQKADLFAKYKLNIHRIDVDFVNGNPTAEVQTADPTEGYTNYYLGHCPQGVTNVHSYNGVTLKNIYRNVDVKYYGGKSDGLKYDLIVNPGGDPNNIKLKYSGVDGMYLKYGHLFIQTSSGEIEERMPRVYQNINGRTVDVEAQYVLVSNNESHEALVTFKLSNYDPQFSLIIDPFVFATYCGGNNTDYSIKIATDAAGNSIAAGYTISVDFPTSPGAFQTGLNGPGDAFAIKLDPNGNRLWSTYYGGNATDEAFGVITDPSGNIVLTGFTTSPDFPVASAYQPTQAGASTYDVFLVKLTPGGLQTWATYYGGKYSETGRGVATDAAGNIFITGETGSPDFPITAGACQTTIHPAYNDIFVAKFTAAGALAWGTYYGGAADETSADIAVDPGGNVGITGFTASTDFPVSAGALQMTNAGGQSDAFAVKFNTSGMPLWSTYVGGNGDEGYSTWPFADIAFDSGGNMFLTGRTGSSNFPATAGSFQPAYGGGGADAFIVKLSPTGGMVWGTYHGGNMWDWGFSISTDMYDNVYLFGEVEDADFGTFPMNTCALQKTFGGNEDWFVSKFSSDGKRVCSTYLGGPAEEDMDFSGAGIATFKNYVFITSLTEGAGFPVTAGAFQTTYAGGFEGVIAKFCGNSCGDDNPVTADFTNAPLSICKNAPATFNASTVSSLNCDTTNYTFQWTFAGASPSTSNVRNPFGIVYPAAGTYTVTLVAKTACGKDSITKTVTVNNCACTLSAISNIGTNVNCTGGSNGSATATYSAGSGGPYTYSWSNGSSGTTTGTSVSASGLTAGTYTVTVSDGACNVVSTVVITQPTVLSIGSVTITKPSCGSSNGNAVAAGSGGTGTYTYTWSNAAAGATASGLAVGIYTVTVKDANGCSITSIVNVANNAGPSFSSVTSSGIACKGTSTGTATVNITGGSAAYNYSWSNGASVTTIGTSNKQVNLVAGIYTITVTDGSGCKSISTVSVTEPASPPMTIFTSSTAVQCTTNGSAGVLVASGTSPYSYLWSTGETTQSLSSIPSGSYTVTITDGNGCTLVQPFTIANTSPLTADFTTSPSGTVCEGTLVNFTASGVGTATTISWLIAPTTPSATGASANFSYSFTTAGTYSVTHFVENASCYNTVVSHVTVINCAVPTVTAAGSTICAGNCTSVTAVGSAGTSPYNYLWSTGATSATINPCPLSTTTYTVTLTDANSTTATTTAVVTVNPAVNANATKNNVTCNGSSDGNAFANPSAGTPGYTYAWSNGSTGQTANGLAQNGYTVTVTDSKGCSSTSTVSIAQPTAIANPTITPTNASCGSSNGSAVASSSGGTGTLTYSWSNGASGQTATALNANTYIVTVTDQSGCTKTASVPISNSPAPTINSITQTPVLCKGGTTGAAVVSATGTGTLTYNWSTGSTLTTIGSKAAGNYTLTVTDGNGCQAITNITITEPATSIIVNPIATTNASCGVNNGTAIATASGGTGALTYTWSNAASGQTNVGLAVNTYTVTVKDANACTQTASTAVLNNSGPAASINVTGAINCNAGAGAITAMAVGGTANYTYSWSTGVTAVTVSASSSLSGLTVNTYSVTITDANGCSSVSSVSLTEPTALSITVNPVDASCSANNGSAIASASGGTGTLTYSWSNGVNGQTNSTLTANTYILTVTDQNACSKTQSVIINNSPAPNISSITQTPVLCKGAATVTAVVSATGTGTLTYSWSTGSTLTTIGAQSAGSYSVTVTDVNGCQAITNVAITEPVSAIAINPVTINNSSCGSNNGSAIATAAGGTGALTYTWSNAASGQTNSNLSANTYVVTVKDANGCTQTASGSVLNNGGPTATASVTGVIVCNGGSGVLLASATGGSGLYTYSWSNGASAITASSNSSLTSVTANNYSVTITDANGCSSISTVALTEPVILTINSTIPTDPTCGGSNGMIIASASGGSGTLTYSWSNGTTGVTDNNLVAAIYTLTVSDANACSKTKIITLSSSPGPTINSIIPTDVLCKGASTGAAVVTATGTGTLTYNWNTSSTAQTLNNLAAGSYTVTVTDGSGCLNIGSVTITEPSSKVAMTSIVASTSGCTANNGTALASASGGTGTLTYSWSTGASGVTIGNLSSNVYTVTVTDANGCSTTGTQTVIASAQIIFSTPTITDANCGVSNGSAVITASGGTGALTYNWSNSATGITANNLASGSYTVVATDANGCVKTTTLIVNSASAQTLVSAVTNESCYGGNSASAQITINGGTAPYTYTWTNGQGGTTATTSVTGTNLSATDYTVTVTDANNCTAIKSVTVTEPAAILFKSPNVNSATCGKSNGSITLSATGGTGTLTYSWSSGASGITAANLTAGNYILTATDANGCTSTQSVGVNNNPGPTIDNFVSADVTCNGTATGSVGVSASGGTGTLAYSWSTGSTAATINNQTAGTYTVTVTDVNGCKAVNTTQITEPLAMAVTVFTSAAACGASNGSATITTLSGGTGALTHTWSTGSTNTTLSNLTAGTYTLTLSDANACTKTTVVAISNNPGPNIVGISQTSPACSGLNTGSASITAVGAGTLTYSWSNGATTQTDSPLIAGSYAVTVTDANSCQTVSAITITEPNPITPGSISVTNTACTSSTGMLTLATTTGGTGAYTYSWSNGTSTSLNTGLSATSYTITITDANGCSKTEAATVGTAGGPAASTSVSSAIKCNGGSGAVTATATGGTSLYTYSWSTGATAITSSLTNSITSLTTSTYSVTITDSNGCSSTNTVALPEPATLNVTASSKPTSCGTSNGIVFATVSGGTTNYTYKWSNASTTQADSSLAEATYTVTVTDANACSATSTTVITTVGTGTVNVTPASQTIVEGNSVTITVSGGTIYTWTPSNSLTCSNCSNPVASPTASTTYTITTIDPHGCPIVGQLTITVKPTCIGDDRDVFIANIFSPNGDGKNDVLYISGNGLTNIYWAIYDRWGNLIFETTDQAHGWDGTMNGSAMETGTYVYYLKATCIKTNTEVKLKGNVSIVK